MNSSAAPAALRLGPWQLSLAARPPFGLVIDGITHDDAVTTPPEDYVNAVLLSPAHRESFLALIDREGLVVCKNVGGDDATHEEVRGRSSRGRLSQGEYYHHDGCSGPTKPRVVEIRCPYQVVARHTATAIAPFREVVYAMLHEVPEGLRASTELAAWRARMADGALTEEDWDVAQGVVIRAIRRVLSAEDARSWLRAVDLRAGAYREPWTMGESRFIANANRATTMQHRRAHLAPLVRNRPNGRLVKRWPAEM